jgi:hypothetical protein
MSDLLRPAFTHFPTPRYAPRRDYSYFTEEPSITRVSRAMGFEPMPWQRFVWAVGTEYRLDSFGRKVYHYTDVLITVPRQSGKTTLLRPLRVYRMIIMASGAHLFSTAQTQKHASKRMLDMVEIVDASQLGPLFKMRRGKGDAGMKLLANGTDLAQFTPNEEAAHGETSAYFDLDEIWFFTKELGDSIMGGIRPSQITLHGEAQRWYTSTMGTMASGFMNTMVEQGRAGTRPGLCYVEFSMPDGLDPYAPATWWTFHPALGNTITEDALRDDMDLPAGEWLRAYMNRITEVQDSLMPLEDWDDLARPHDAPALSEVSVAFEVAPGNTCAAVVACWHDPATGAPTGHVLHQAPGTLWVIPYLRMLHARGVRAFAADDGGPVRRLLDDIGDTLPVRALTFGERRLADQTLLAAARDDATLIHDGSKPLRLAMASAQTRINNGVEVIDRDHSLQPVPSLIALSVGLFASAHPVAQHGALIVT